MTISELLYHTGYGWISPAGQIIGTYDDSNVSALLSDPLLEPQFKIQIKMIRDKTLLTNLDSLLEYGKELDNFIQQLYATGYIRLHVDSDRLTIIGEFRFIQDMSETIEMIRTRMEKKFGELETHTIFTDTVLHTGWQIRSR